MAALANPKRELFAQQVAAGTPAGQAYAEVYGNQKTSDAAASRLLKKVKPRVAEIQQGVPLNSTLLTIANRRELLKRFAQDATEKTADRIRAIELDARLAGDLVEKLEHSGTVGLITPERRAEKARQILASRGQ